MISQPPYHWNNREHENSLRINLKHFYIISILYLKYAMFSGSHMFHTYRGGISTSVISNIIVMALSILAITLFL